MSAPLGEFFYNDGYGYGYDPAWYNGYNPGWLLGRPVALQPLAYPIPEPKKAFIDVIELEVPFCCEGCVEKVYKKLNAMEGVASVHCDTENKKVTVKGTIKPDKLLKKVRKIKGRSKFWGNLIDTRS